jgi:hypothetical protein
MAITDATDARDAPQRSRSRPTLSAPVTVSRFWKNRAHDAIVIELATYKNKNVLDVRTYVMNRGRLVATPRGISLAVLRLPDLAKAINLALKQAKALGLLPDDGAVGK